MLSLPRSVRRLATPTHDPRTTPFVEQLADVKRIYLKLPSPLNSAYAIGALAGLRTGEVFALRCEHVDLAARRIHVRESVKGPRYAHLRPDLFVDEERAAIPLDLTPGSAEPAELWPETDQASRGASATCRGSSGNAGAAL